MHTSFGNQVTMKYSLNIIEGLLNKNWVWWDIRKLKALAVIVL